VTMKLLASLMATLLISMSAQADPGRTSTSPQRVAATLSDDALLEDLERRTFQYFWDTANPRTGMVPDRYPSPSFASIAGVGFGLTAYVVGAERGYVTRAQARQRTLNTLRFLAGLPQGPDEAGVAGYNGFYYHFIDMDSGLRYSTSELSTVDTTLLLAGVLLSQAYFDRQTAAEREIRELAETIYGRVDWTWAQNRPPVVAHGWRPETGFLRHDWRGYCEAMLLYVLALGSPTYPIESEAWDEWLTTYKRSWGSFFGYDFLAFGSMFGHQYSHIWIDFRGIRDAYMRERGIDYFENSRRALQAQHAYAQQNPMGWRGYDAQIWGLTASDGPADTVQIFNGEERGFFTYSARGTAARHVLDDGTIAPTATIGSIVFAPELVLPTIRAFRARYGDTLYQRYGFLDAINPSFTFTGAPLRHGHIVEGIGWVDSDYLGIDQGPIIAMVENYRSGLIWKLMERSPHLRRGLERAGFTGGWLQSPPDHPVTLMIETLSRNQAASKSREASP
jgi:hypothetical protein